MPPLSSVSSPTPSTAGCSAMRPVQQQPRPRPRPEMRALGVNLCLLRIWMALLLQIKFCVTKGVGCIFNRHGGQVGDSFKIRLR